MQNEPDIQNELGKPVLVFFQLLARAHHTNLRHYEFMQGGLAELSAAHGDIQRVIISGALRSLHPINHAASFGIGCAGSPRKNPRIKLKLLEIGHGVS